MGNLLDHRNVEELILCAKVMEGIDVYKGVSSFLATLSRFTIIREQNCVIDASVAFKKSLIWG